MKSFKRYNLCNDTSIEASKTYYIVSFVKSFKVNCTSSLE